MATPVNAGFSRVWVVENGVHIDRAPEYQALAKITDPSFNFGEDSRIEAPDPNQFDRFIEVGSVRGTVERPTMGVMGRYPLSLSNLLKLARKKCRLDIFVLIGNCKNPQDFTSGWQKIVYFPDGKISTYSAENLGAISSDENSPTNETIDMSARDMYEFGLMSFERLATAEATREISTIDVCDNETCGDCGDPSDGCQKIIATMAGVGATPGTKPSILYSEDQGQTISSQDITTLFSSEAASDGECIGENFVIVSNDSGSLHYTNTTDLFLDASNIWVEVIAGFVSGNNPNHMDSLDVNHTWIVGDNGYVYFSKNPVLGVVVQDNGIATTQNLNWVSAFDAENVLAVGALNAVVVTNNGGDSWRSVLGPAPGITLNTCHMWSKDVWLIGGSQGTLHYTVDGGANWKTKELPIAATEIDVIEFANEAEGHMAVQFGTGAARILRTQTGGYEWKVLPDDHQGTTPIGDYFNDLAVCGPAGKNTVFGAGLDDDGTTGIIVKAEA